MSSSKTKTIRSWEELINSTLYKKAGHDAYYYYISCIPQSPYFLFFPRLGCGSKNDPDETDPEKEGYVGFHRCLSYFQDETVNMWYLYASKGCCIRLTKAVIESMGAKKRIYKDCLFRGDRDGKRLFLSERDFLFERKHVLYIGEAKEIGKANFDLYLRSTHKAYVPKSLLRRVQKDSPTKRACWSSETELRLYLWVKKEVVEKWEKEGGAIDSIKVLIHPTKSQITAFETPFLEVPIGQKNPQEWKISSLTSKLKGHVLISDLPCPFKGCKG